MGRRANPKVATNVAIRLLLTLAGPHPIFSARKTGSNKGGPLSHRALLIPVEAINHLRKELISTLGPRPARAALTRFGYAMGYGEAMSRRDQWGDDEAWLGRAREVLQENRLADITLSTVATDPAARTFRCTAEITKSFEVARENGHPDANTNSSACWILTGFLSGFSSALFGSEVHFDEVHCAVTGGGCCRMEGLTPGLRPPADAAALALVFQGENITEEMTAVIDELAQKNRELAQAVAMLKAQQEATPDGVLIVDLEGKVLSFSARFLAIWGIPDDIAASRDDAAMLALVLGRLKEPDAFITLVRDLYQRPLASRQDDSIEFKDGTIIQRTTVPVLHEDGKPMARAWYFRDVTAQRKLEAEYRQFQKMEAMGTLAGGIAHDFNNLLTVIGGHIAVVEQRLVPQRGASSTEVADLQAATRAVESASKLTRALLNFSRQTPVSPRPLDLGDLIAETLNLMRRTIDPAVAIESRLEAGLWPVLADSGQMQQVITNLCLNARDAMPDGGRLVIEASNTTESTRRSTPGQHSMGEYITLKVSDTGCGMTPEVQARIFDPFFTTKSIGKGTGLGLSMAYGILCQHGASIRCESAPGKGTSFTLRFPRAESQVHLLTSPEAKLEQGGGETILLVEDQEMVRSLGRRILQERGYNVFEAGDGVEALEIYREHVDAIGLVILDMLMPRMSGREAFLEIRGISPTVPILICTGFVGETQLEELLKTGPTTTLDKPFTPDSLIKTVRRILDGETAENASLGGLS